jgi:hypothetical protein
MSFRGLALSAGPGGSFRGNAVLALLKHLLREASFLSLHGIGDFHRIGWGGRHYFNPFSKAHLIVFTPWPTEGCNEFVLITNRKEQDEFHRRIGAQLELF